MQSDISLTTSSHNRFYQSPRLYTALSKPLMRFFICCILVIVSTEVFASIDGSTPSKTQPTRSIITLWDIDPSEQTLYFQQQPLSPKQILKLSNVWSAVFSLPNQNISSHQSSIEQLMLSARRHPNIISAERNANAQTSLIPNDPSFTDSNFNQSHHSQINSPQAWDQRTDCSNVVIAVVDTGIDIDHPDLASNLWQNPNEIPNNNVDDDNNGYVDDLNGACVRSDCDGDAIEDGFGHGSHVAGLIAAQGNNLEGVTGVCWNAQLMIVKSLGDNGSGSVSDVSAGINYAVNNGADIINASLTISSYSSALRSAVEQANQQGVLIITAAGNFGSNNDQTPVYPANFRNEFDNLMAIANVNSGNKLHSNSNFGSESVDMAAPGVNIFSTWMSGQYANSTGTSMSAPLVTATAALMLSEVDQSDLSLKSGLLSSGSSASDLEWQVVSPVILDSDAAITNTSTTPLSIFRASASDGSYQLFGYDVSAVQTVTYTEPLTSGEQVTEFTVFENQTNRSLSVTLPDESKSGIFQLHNETESSNQLFVKRSISSPSNVSFTRNENQITLSWSTPLNADEIRIERGIPGGAFEEIAELSSPNNVYQDSVDASVSYYYRLRGSYDYVSPTTNTITTELSSYSTTIVTRPEDTDSFSYWITETLPTFGIGSSVKIQLTASTSGSYALESGALPTGLSLSASGVISGTVTNQTTSSFSIAFSPTGKTTTDIKPFSITVTGSSAGTMELVDQQSLNIQVSASTGTLSSVQELSPSSFNSLDGLSIQLIQQVLISDLPVSASETSEITMTISNAANGQFTDVYLANTNNQWLSSADIANSQVASNTASILVEDGSEFDLDNQVNGEITARIASVSANEATSSSSGGDSRCFIASAVYPSGHKDLATLRQFRDNTLKNLPGGNWLIHQYYENSPHLVVWMKSHHTVMWVTRFMIESLSTVLRSPVIFSVLVLLFLIIWRRIRYRRHQRMFN